MEGEGAMVDGRSYAATESNGIYVKIAEKSEQTPRVRERRQNCAKLRRLRLGLDAPDASMRPISAQRSLFSENFTSSKQ